MLSPMMQCGGRIRVKGCQFGTGDGSTRNFQLVDRHGHPVTKDVHVWAMHQTDWQGRLALSNQPRTNYALNSSNPSLWYTPLITAGAPTTAPDGTAGAFFCAVPSTTSGLHYARTSAAVPANTLVTASFFANAAGYTKAILETAPFGTIGSNRSFDLSAGSVSAGTGSASISAVPNQPGIYRCAVTFTTGAGPYTNSPSVFVQQYGNYAGDGVSGVYIWGMQVENAASAGIYIPTTSAPVTVTDYAVDSSGNVTLGQSPAAGATLGWDGTARRSA